MATEDLTFYDYLQTAQGSGKFFYSIMESFPQGIIITNAADKIIYANMKMAQLTGHSRKDLIGKILHLFLHFPDQQEKLKNIMEQRLTGIYESYELYIKRKNGSHFMGHILTAPYKDTIDNISGTISLITDISLSRAAELQALAVGATKSLNSVLITDRYGKIEWVNEGFTKLSGFYLYEVIDTNGEILRRDDQDLFLQKLSMAVREKKPILFDCRNYNKAGDEYWVKCTLTPVLDVYGGVKEIIIIETDITEYKKIEEKLRLRNN